MRRPSARARFVLLRLAAAMPVAACLLAPAGCEERVVSARGLGADQYKIQEPMYEAPAWERAITGDPRSRSRDRLIIRQDPPQP